MKRENNKKFKKRKRNQNRSLTCRVLSMMFAIVLFCSTVLINTDYVSQASSFDDMVDMVEVEEDSAAVDTSEDTGDDLGTDVNFESEESTDETYSESDDLGSSDADFSSGENMFTDGTSESSAPTEEAAQPVSCIVNLKNETIEIKAEAPAGVLPNGTQMIVKAVENNTEDAELTDQYNKLAAKITEQLQNQGKNLDGFLAYNVSFTDADGNPVEPSDKVTYSFTYKEASSPELTDPAASTVTAAMIRTNKETSELELTELKAEEDQLTVETNESRQLTKAAFQSAATAAYTFVWSSTPAADDNENNENKEENGEVNNEEVNADTNIENTEENGEETNTENNVENSEEEQNPEEAPDQEQIKMIRIIADEVNLREAPSTEAEVIAAVSTGTELPLLETVTAEDGTIWYKVSYDETEAYVRSDFAEVVETEEQGTENEDANEEEPEVQVEDEVTYYQTIDNVVVTATAAKDVLPEGAQFVVTPIKSEDAQYEDIAARLEEKAANEEYSIAGFLAYDIYFQDSEGNKINPEDGKVKISMEYQNATAPEEVKESDAVQMDAEEEETSQENTEAKELSVSVMHFVEENGEVTSVVDMTKENSAAVETNEAGEVQKAEFETESFSTFTITWKYYSSSKALDITIVDTSGNEIGNDTSKTIDLSSDSAEVNVDEIAPQVSGYKFKNARLENYSDGKEIKRLRRKSKTSSEIQYSTKSSKDSWKKVDKTVYFVYERTEQLLTYVNTVDSKSKGINIKMIDYDGQQFQGYEWAQDAQEIKQGILSKTLGEDGYPTFVTDNNWKNGNSLKDTSLASFYTSAIDANHLFLESVYNAPGKYFYYNSEENGASFNSKDGNFQVFTELTTPENGDRPTYKRGNFLPYNTFNNKNKSTNTNLYNSRGERLPESSARYGDKLYLPDGDTPNYYFGMEMDAKFIQGKNGYYDGNPMKYEFTGDDDLWVYIDGVLVLDMGGCHEARSGSIDFSTGEVTVENQRGTTLQACFEETGKYNENDWNHNGTFKDYTTHTIKMFYMERGAGASNLKIKFNLPTVPDGQVKVTKELSNTDKEKYANVNFAFQIFAQKLKDDGNYSDEYELLGSGSGAKKENGEPLNFKNNVEFENETYNNVFYLKAGETAVFNGLKANRKYYVKEIGVNSNEYDKVTINNTEVTTGNGQKIESEKESVGERAVIVFKNNCSAENSRELQITKKIKNDISVTDKFDFRVQLNGQNYTGNYYLKDSAGNYYTRNEDGTLNKEDGSKVCGTAADGVISSVPAGYTVSITQILSGTTFRVEEINLNTTDYGTPEYKIENADATDASQVATGTIQLGKDAKVTVTNTLTSVAELVMKKVNTKGEILPGAEFTLASQADESKTYKETSDEKGIIKFEKLHSGTYTLTESKVPSGYENRNTWIVKVEKNAEDNAVATLYEADGKTEVVKDSKDNYYHIVNYTHQELIESELERSKTATVIDEENRKYRIDISAESKSKSKVQEKRNANVVLVLDMSGSMNDPLGDYVYVGTNTAETREKLSTSGTTYYLKSKNKYYEMTYYKEYGWYVSGNSLENYYDEYEIYSRQTRLQALKSSVTDFINNLKVKAPDCNVGITAFSSDYYNESKKINGKTNKMVRVGDKSAELITFVNGLYASGGTIPAYQDDNKKTGLYKAKELLNGITDNKNVIMFTDGAPTGDNKGYNGNDPAWNDDVVKEANKAAKELKDADCSVYTIGFALTEQAEKFLAGGTYGTTEYPGIASSPECAKTANDAASLSELFRTFEQTILNDIDITNATITDTIDSRFDLLDDRDGHVDEIITENTIGDDEIALKNGGKLTLKNGGEVRYVNGNLQIKWENVTIPNKKKQTPWSNSLNVKAKDTYVGGNNVTTNVREGSNITFGAEKVDLPQPTVNVKGRIYLNDKEITIYKGDSAPMQAEVQNWLFATSEKTSYAAGTIGNSDSGKLQYEWYTDYECKKPATSIEGNPDKDTSYYLKVTYKDGDFSIVATNKDNENHPYGIYKIKVISGQIDIIKKVNERSSESREFKFNVTKNDQAIEGSPFTVTVPAQSDTGSLSEKDKAKLTNLSRGTYVVSEDVENGYRIAATDVTGTDCKNSVEAETNVATFTLGDGIKTEKNVINNYTYNSADGGIKAVVSYTNEVVADLDLKKTNSEGNTLSGAIFELKKWEGNDCKTVNDNIEVDNTEGNKELTSLLAGRYMLTETKAPDGYSKLGSSIYFKVENGTVTLTDKDGNPTGEGFELWQLDIRSTTPVLTIKNQKLYSLPESGGNGIYWYMIGGMVLMSTAAWILYKNKCREVLGK